MDEVLKAVKGVNWRRLGKELIGEWKSKELIGEWEDDPFALSYVGSEYTNLDRIHDEHESDEARLRTVVEQFLSRRPSWRRVIWALYCADEIDKAQQIRSYAEP